MDYPCRSFADVPQHEPFVTSKSWTVQSVGPKYQRNQKQDYDQKDLTEAEYRVWKTNGRQSSVIVEW